jgi:hypothetical protein
MRPGLILMGAVALVIAGCSQTTAIRILDSIAGYSCIVSERVAGAEPCPEPEIAIPAPLFCKETIAGIECYSDERPFGLQPGWLRAGPPEIGG